MMSQKHVGNFIPVSGVIKLLILLAIGLQLIVISQIYFFRADILSEPVTLIIRLLRGITLTFLAGAILTYPCTYFIRFLNKKFPWKSKSLKRLIIQFPVAILLGILVTPIIIIPAGFIGLEAGLQTLINNAYYLIMLALFLMVILEARIYFDESASSRQETEK